MKERAGHLPTSGSRTRIDGLLPRTDGQHRTLTHGVNFVGTVGGGTQGTSPATTTDRAHAADDTMAMDVNRPHATTLDPGGHASSNAPTGDYFPPTPPNSSSPGRDGGGCDVSVRPMVCNVGGDVEDDNTVADDFNGDAADAVNTAVPDDDIRIDRVTNDGGRGDGAADECTTTNLVSHVVLLCSQQWWIVQLLVASLLPFLLLSSLGGKFCLDLGVGWCHSHMSIP